MKSSNDPLVLGIDPGSRRLGWAVFNMKTKKYIESGDISLAKMSSTNRRILKMGDRVFELINYLMSEPYVNNIGILHDLAVEEIFLGRNIRSAFILGQLFAICNYIGHSVGLDCFSYGARTVKKFATTSGSSSKEDVKGFMSLLPGITLREKKSYDEYDAIALAYTHCYNFTSGSKVIF